MPETRTRARWIADHGWRRVLLGRRLGCAPAAVDYLVGEHGKPSPAGGGWQFSASRSAGSALYGLSCVAEVGVDHEHLQAAAPTPVRRVFSARERAALEATPDALRRAAALACWVRKEAYLKALGTGLRFPVDGIEVWAGDERDVRHGEVVVRTPALGPDIVAALAVRVGAGPAAEITVAVEDLHAPV
jgi:4'-phosphopantetheinyl transferase